MASLVANLFKRVIKVRVEGVINHKLTDKIIGDLRGSRFYTPDAVVIVVNSPGGSLAQAKHISDTIRNYGARNNVPIYCFAEDQCLGSANVVLTTGVKVYANQMTLLGEFGYGWSSLWFKKFSQNYKIKVDYVHSGENKVKFNPFEQLKPESEKWMKNYLYLLEHDLKCTVINHRQRSLLQKNKMDKDKIQQKIFKKAIISAEQAVQHGLIDGIMNCDDILNTSLRGTKVVEVNKKDRFEKLKRVLDYATSN